MQSTDKRAEQQGVKVYAKIAAGRPAMVAEALSEHYSLSDEIKKFGLKLNLLLVEDHPIVQKAHKLMLEMAGCQVDVAVTGTQALAIYNKKPYDVILLDVGLPDISGISVCETIRRQEQLDGSRRIPIVVLTAFSHDDIEEQCKAVGVDEVATKPVKFEDLQALLLRWSKKRT